jgi:hypothetical protein
MLGLFPEERSSWLHALFDTPYLRKRTSELKLRAEEAFSIRQPDAVYVSEPAGRGIVLRWPSAGGDCASDRLEAETLAV